MFRDCIPPIRKAQAGSLNTHISNSRHWVTLADRRKHCDAVVRVIGAQEQNQNSLNEEIEVEKEDCGRDKTSMLSEIGSKSIRSMR